VCQVPDLGGLTLARAAAHRPPKVATRTTIRLIDDHDGRPAEQTARSGLGATEYESELTPAAASRRRIHNVHSGVRDTATHVADRPRQNEPYVRVKKRASGWTRHTVRFEV